MLNYPRLFFLVSLFVLWLSAQIGASLRSRRALEDEEREDFGIVQAATLTLLGLIIGFSFSMAVSRYDLRKNYEEAEANAIGTEYVRTGLVPAATAAGVRTLLRKYLDLRILFYRTRDQRELQQINTDTAQIQNRDVVRSTRSGCGATVARDRARHCGYERRFELAGIHSGRMVESHSKVGLGLDDNDRHLLQPFGRVCCA